MSLKAVSWAIEQDLSPVHKVILITLAMFQNDETGLCCPSKKRLAALVNISEATLKRQIAALEREGWIVRKARFGKKSGLQTSNAYFINFKKGRRLNMSPLPQYDDLENEAAQNEPAQNPGGSYVEPPGGSHAEPPTSLKGTLNKEGARAPISKFSKGKKAEPPAGAEAQPEMRRKIGSQMGDLVKALRMSQPERRRRA